MAKKNKTDRRQGALERLLVKSEKTEKDLQEIYSLQQSLGLPANKPVRPKPKSKTPRARSKSILSQV